jgi:hypothetical protein
MTEKFSFNKALIKVTGRAFLLTAAWLFVACRAIIASPGESWVACALIIAGIVTALNITGDKIVDAIAAAIANARVNVDLRSGSGSYAGKTTTSGYVTPIPDWTAQNPPTATYQAESSGNGRLSEKEMETLLEAVDKGAP